MRKLSLVLLSVLFLTAACAKKNSENNSSIKSDYKEKVEFITAIFEQSLARASFDDSTHELLVSKLSEARDLIPFVGLTVRKSVDSAKVGIERGSISDEWKFSDGPAYKIEKISIWVFCSPQMIVGEFSISHTAPRYRDNYSERFSPKSNVSHLLTPVVNYEESPPQFEVYPNAVVYGALNLKVETQSSCFRRYVMDYTGFDNGTVEAIKTWRANVDQIIVELSELKTSARMTAYPVSYKIKELSEKLKIAYSALP